MGGGECHTNCEAFAHRIGAQQVQHAVGLVGWTLAEMSQNPRAVMTWHAKLSKTIPTTADHCARLIRACYREEARLDRTLNPAASLVAGRL